jgi:hypothetical protein
MNNVLTFIIPVRHQQNSKNWALLKKNLTDTLRSISNQNATSWKGVVIANIGADLPVLPPEFDVKWVDFPPNELHSQGNADKEVFYDAFRVDKGRRVLAGMLHAGEMGHVMIVDDDDFVSSRRTQFVAANPSANGWFIKHGYVWADGGQWLYQSDDFSHLCGSSHIIRADLYNLPSSQANADDSYIRKVLGSHMYLHGHLDSSGTPLAALPFFGAVYRIGHPGAHSRSNGIFRQCIIKRDLLKQPWRLFTRIARLRMRNTALNQEYFGLPEG